MLDVFPDSKFNAIIANPPFAKNQDIDHIKIMYNALATGGRMVTISSQHWAHSKNKKETEFRDWLNEVSAEVIEIEKGRFKESGTLVGAYIIVIDK
jgi:16S rRNA G1207 methylase RsmC